MRISNWSRRVVRLNEKGREDSGERKMNRLLLVLTTVIIGQFACSTAYAKEGNCTTEFETACVRRVSCSFHEKVIKEKREFKIEYKRPGQKEEVIADCGWRNGQFSCDPTKGFTCDKQPSNNFSVLIDIAEKCLTDGEIIFDVAHDQIIRCKLSNGKGNTDLKVENDKKLESANTLQRGQGGNGVTVGVSCAAVVIVVLVVLAVSVFLWRRRRQGRTEQKNKPEIEKSDHDKENEQFL